MNLSLPQIVAGAVGALLIYAAIKDSSPITVVKDALKGQVTPAGAGNTRYGSADSMERAPSVGATGTTAGRIEGRVDGFGNGITQPVYKSPSVGWSKTGI